MADPKLDSRPADYSSSQAPETQDAAHRDREHDHRAIPGGDPSRATMMFGMESVDRDENAANLAGHPAEAERPVQDPGRRHQDSRRGDRQ